MWGIYKNISCFEYTIRNFYKVVILRNFSWNIKYNNIIIILTIKYIDYYLLSYK